MEMKKIMIVLCIIFLVEISLFIGGVDSRALRTEQTNGCDQTATATVEGGGFGFFSATANNSSDRLLMRSLAFRLASGPSRRGRGH
ncbi:unnamed protein product [Arabis nemorensis]|uniref:Transmembrane protein n=1 Tax=Arabis nemorensis TaxID=586526 RepID=A0A565ATT3_9BRAS|nr:unnamed protein product [Arabis nemorensis]